MDRQHDGKWSRLAQESISGDAPWTISASRVEAGTIVTVGGKTFGPFDLPGGSMGFAFESGRVAFTAIEIDGWR